MNQKYEKEIEEILKKAGASPPEQQPENPEEAPASSSPRRRSMPTAPGAGLRRAASINYKHLLLSGVTLLAVSIFFGGLPMFLIGAALLVGGYILYYRAPRSGRGGSGRTGGGRPPKMWRGRTIDPGDDPHFTDDLWGGRR